MNKAKKVKGIKPKAYINFLMVFIGKVRNLMIDPIKISGSARRYSRKYIFL